MNIPNERSAAGNPSGKDLWIGMVEVRPGSVESNITKGEAKGAFVNIVTWASGAEEYRRNAELVLSKLGQFVVDVENPEPVSVRRRKVIFDEEIEDTSTIFCRPRTWPSILRGGTGDRPCRRRTRGGGARRRAPRPGGGGQRAHRAPPAPEGLSLRPEPIRSRSRRYSSASISPRASRSSRMRAALPGCGSGSRPGRRRCW